MRARNSEKSQKSHERQPTEPVKGQMNTKQELEEPENSQVSASTNRIGTNELEEPAQTGSGQRGAPDRN